MKQRVSKISKLALVLTAGVVLASCGSVGGFNELLGISNKGIDENSVEVNEPLKNAQNGDLPTPQGGAIAKVSVTTPQVEAPKIVAPKIVAPKIVAPKITTPKVVAPKVVAKVVTPVVVEPVVVTPIVVTPVVVTPKVETPNVETPKVEVQPIVVASTPAAKISPLAYKFIDLFTFRSDMRAGKLINALATAKRIAAINPSCKLEGVKFTCGEYFISVK